MVAAETAGRNLTRTHTCWHVDVPLLHLYLGPQKEECPQTHLVYSHSSHCSYITWPAEQASTTQPQTAAATQAKKSASSAAHHNPQPQPDIKALSPHLVLLVLLPAQLRHHKADWQPQWVVGSQHCRQALAAHTGQQGVHQVRCHARGTGVQAHEAAVRTRPEHMGATGSTGSRMGSGSVLLSHALSYTGTWGQ